MTNFEKYFAEIYRLTDLKRLAVTINDKIGFCGKIHCEKCKFRSCAESCKSQLKEWLLSESQPDLPILTEFDSQYLKYCLSCGYKYIARDDDSNLFVFENEPSYGDDGSYYDPVNGNVCECISTICKSLDNGVCVDIFDILKQEEI